VTPPLLAPPPLPEDPPELAPEPPPFSDVVAEPPKLHAAEIIPNAIAIARTADRIFIEGLLPERELLSV
jgi:hypothetical protein